MYHVAELIPLGGTMPKPLGNLNESMGQTKKKMLQLELSVCNDMLGAGLLAVHLYSIGYFRLQTPSWAVLGSSTSQF